MHRPAVSRGVTKIGVLGAQALFVLDPSLEREVLSSRERRKDVLWKDIMLLFLAFFTVVIRLWAALIRPFA